MFWLWAVSQFTVNAIVARFSDTHHLNRKILIICAIYGALSFLYILHHHIWLFIIVYAIFQGLFAPMPQLYASARESINASSSRNNAKFANTVLRSMFSFGFYLVHSLVHTHSIYGAGLGGTVIILHCYKYSFIKIEYKRQVKDTASIEITAPNMLKDKTYLFHLLLLYFYILVSGCIQ